MAVSVPQSILLLLTTYPEYDILNALSSILEVLASALQNLTVPFFEPRRLGNTKPACGYSRPVQAFGMKAVSGRQRPLLVRRHHLAELFPPESTTSTEIRLQGADWPSAITD